MALFKQIKDAKKAVEAAPALVDQTMQMATQAQQMAAAQQAAAQHAAPHDDGGDLEPIAGVSLELFATVCRELAAYGHDQSKAPGLAAAHGVSAEDWQSAMDGWNARVTASPAVAKQFSAHYHGS
jgi:hypothetical protein